ncbi:hypothetical protein PDJAM_G00155890 [Pangasius djambal]|uniref:Uncharacterized protein n=1 Tax=Pangasius djambal TaxID=1691987 RepID=A0ACC5ZJ77_9TELE|nr:hypothetical protein [Pangasius djambal]
MTIQDKTLSGIKIASLVYIMRNLLYRRQRWMYELDSHALFAGLHFSDHLQE